MNKLRVFAIVLAGLTGLLLLAANPAQARPLSGSNSVPLATLDSKKIDPELAKEITTAGQADFFIWLAEKADLSPAYKLATKAEKGRFVFDTLQATAHRTQKNLISWLDAQGVEYRSFYIANNILVHNGSRALLSQVAARSDVARLTPNTRSQAPKLDNKSGLDQQVTGVEPNISFINADDVWGLGITGQGIVLADNDTGLDVTHPAIAGHYRGCLNPPACTQWDHNYSWWDASGASPNAPVDDYGFGTYETGIMLGDDGAGNQIGVAPGARTISCKLVDANGGWINEWGEVCFEWDLAPWDLNGQNPDPAQAPDAVSSSYFGLQGDNIFRDEVDALQAAGILVVAPAGDDGPACTSLETPGDYAEVLTAGAVNSAFAFPGQLDSFSGRGSSTIDAGYFPDVVAPGKDVRSSLPGGEYGYFNTTLASTPHVTGLVGLLWSANPLLRGQVAITDYLIQHTAAPLSGQMGSSCGGNYNTGPNNDWGYGTIDALAAVKAALDYDGAGTLTGVVTDTSHHPIQGASVWASSGPKTVFQATTDADGVYAMQVYSGTYTVSAMAYGYNMSTYSDVSVISGTTTVQDFTLSLADLHTLSGAVRDAVTGWPLYAHITVQGDPVTPSGIETWSDPQTGDYSLILAEGVTYTLQVKAFFEGYQSGEFSVPPLSGDATQDLTLDADPYVCPTGYEFHLSGLAEQFESQDTPPGWEVVDNAGTGAVWVFNDPAGRTNLTGGGGNFAIADSDWAGQVDMDTELRSPVMDFSTFTTVNLAFNQDLNYWGTIADVDVSIHGSAGPWINVWTNDEASVPGPAQTRLDISAIAAGQSEVMVRFHFYHANLAGWWEVDRVMIGTWGCMPQPGGLVVGNVTDANTGLSLNDALVSVDTGQSTKTVTTPLDPQVEDGLYQLFSPAGTRTITTTLGGYSPVTLQVNVVPSDAVRQDFDLDAGWLKAVPGAFELTLKQGQTGTLPLTLTNLGGIEAAYDLLEIDNSSSDQGKNASPDAPRSPGWFPSYPIPGPLSAYVGVQCADAPDSFYLVGGQSDFLVPVDTLWRFDATVPQWVGLAPLPQPVELASATCYEGKIYLAGGSDNNNWETNTLYIYDIASDTWTQGADLPRASWQPALGAWNGHLYLAGGTGMNNAEVDIYNISTDSWIAGGGTPIPQTTAIFGWAQIDSYLYLVGGYGNQIDIGSELNQTQRYDMATDTWEQGPTFFSKRDAFALGVTEKYLYAIGGDLPGGGNFDFTPQVEILDHTAWPYGAWKDLGDPLPHEMGFQYSFCTPMHRGAIWSVGGADFNLIATTYNWYRLTEDCYQTPTDVGWLSADTVSGSLGAGKSKSIQVILDASLPTMEPGEYQAQLRVNTDTPYGATFIPVQLTVTPGDYALKLEPPTSEQSGFPGNIVTYTLQLTNIGLLTDTYDLTAAGNGWEVILPVTQTTLSPGQGIDILVQVKVPVDAYPDEQDVVAYTATSQGDPGKTKQVELTTTAVYFRICLPVIRK